MGPSALFSANAELLVSFLSSGTSRTPNLVERIVETLVEILEVQQHNRLAGLHTDLDTVDVTTHLTNSEQIKVNIF